jgi:hypothetical protein
MTPEQLQADIARHQHYWEEKMHDYSPTRREQSAPYAESWMRIQEAFGQLQETIAALRVPAVAVNAERE